MVIYPPDLMYVPRPVAFEDETRVVWTGTFSESGRRVLQESSLGGNESYTLEIGARFLIALLGMSSREDSEAAAAEVWEYCDQHKGLGDILRRNMRKFLNNLE